MYMYVSAAAVCGVYRLGVGGGGDGNIQMHNVDFYPVNTVWGGDRVQHYAPVPPPLQF
jgi:hypothetical protein